MRAVSDYLALVPPEHAHDANFMAELALVLQPFADIQTLLAALPSLFDLDYAVGVQLDATGAWIGQSRVIPVPVINPWFSWDTAGLGWDQGYWQGPYDGVGLASLDDTTYRRLLYAVRFANNSDGTQASIQAALQEYFSTSPANTPLGSFAIGDSPLGLVNTSLFVIDATDYAPGAGSTGDFNNDFSTDFSGQGWPFQSAINLVMQVGLAGKLPNIVDLSILEQQLIPVFPAAVQVQWAVTTVDGAPVFGFDVSNNLIGGWDVGAWGADPGWVAENIVL